MERLAKTKYLRRGGGAPVADRLTTRSGRLARSIAVNLAGLPRFATVGTNVIYAPPHEFGGRVTQQVPQHTRSVVFGRRVAPFSVGPYSRTVTFPKRPFLTPAVRDVGARFFPKELRRQARRAIRRKPMSITIDIETDLLAKFVTASGGTSSPAPIPMDGIPSYPYAFPVNPSWEGEALDWGQVENTRSHPLLFWWSKSDTAPRCLDRAARGVSLWP